MPLFLQRESRQHPAAAAKRVDFAWELGGHTGHVSTLLPIARAMRSRGHEVRFLLRDVGAGTDLEGAGDIPREPAPVWSGPLYFPSPRNFGEILHNFGYGHPASLQQLVKAWRARLAGSRAVIASVAPAAHIAARTLRMPSFEISQGFHIPPPTMPAPLLRDWVAGARAQTEAVDRAVVAAINEVLAAHEAPALSSIGELFAGRSMLLTYPELDLYPGRGPAEYFGIPHSSEGSATPDWPAGSGPRVFAYLYSYFPGLEGLLDALARTQCRALVLCRGIDRRLREKHAGGSVFLSEQPMSVSRLLPQADIVACHASHQMTAQALLAGKPVLLMPTQLEQFLIMRRVVRQGLGLGISPEDADADFATGIARLRSDPSFLSNARAFALRYAGHDRGAALATIVERCEAAIGN